MTFRDTVPRVAERVRVYQATSNRQREVTPGESAHPGPRRVHRYTCSSCRHSVDTGRSPGHTLWCCDDPGLALAGSEELCSNIKLWLQYNLDYRSVALPKEYRRDDVPCSGAEVHSGFLRVNE